MYFGVDYYPEHWPRERWETDAELMSEMGIQMVRMAEFSWHKMEPEEGEFDFGWLDEAIELLGKKGIKTVLGTPTAAPPAWLVRKYPQIRPIDREGHIKEFGGRHHTCHSSRIYRKKVTKIVTAMAEHFCDNPYVIGWQPDNELGNSHDNLCFCDSCTQHFRDWLKRKYGSVDALNHAWGTAFWSQEHNSFEEVIAPRMTAAGENPSSMLDWKCFCSDLIVDFLQLQADIIRKYCPKHFITHNYMGFANKVDYYELGKQLDFVSHDQYPLTLPGKGQSDNYLAASTLDVVRSYKGKTFWIMEQQAGPWGWGTTGKGPKPGQLSLWMLQSIAHGADAVVFFRWRTCAMGTEQFWHGILPHHGIPGRRYTELRDAIKEITPFMDELQGNLPKAEVGIVFSFKQNYALDIQPQNWNLRYTEQVQKYYRAFYEKNVPIDFVPEDGDFEKYKLLVAPLQYLMSPMLEEKYLNYVKNGGHLVLTMRCGVKDVHNLCMTERPLPGKLADAVGIEVDDYEGLESGQVSLNWNGNIYHGELWCDILKIVGEHVQTLAVYDSEYYKGSPCITENKYGKGTAYYVATAPEEECLSRLAGHIMKAADIESLGKADTEVELAIRENQQKSWIFVINHSGEEKKYVLKDSFHMVKGSRMGTLKPYEVQIVVREKNN